MFFRLIVGEEEDLWRDCRVLYSDTDVTTHGALSDCKSKSQISNSLSFLPQFVDFHFVCWARSILMLVSHILNISRCAFRLSDDGTITGQVF